MEFLLFFLIVFAMYCIFCKIIANLIQPPCPRRRAFWWVFFLSFLGAIIYILLGIRDGK